jgi:hypothetical protein
MNLKRGKSMAGQPPVQGHRHLFDLYRERDEEGDGGKDGSTGRDIRNATGS